jgi:hypothetical protein
MGHSGSVDDHCAVDVPQHHQIATTQQACLMGRLKFEKAGRLRPSGKTWRIVPKPFPPMEFRWASILPSTSRDGPWATAAMTHSTKAHLTQRRNSNHRVRQTTVNLASFQGSTPNQPAPTPGVRGKWSGCTSTVCEAAKTPVETREKTCQRPKNQTKPLRIATLQLPRGSIPIPFGSDDRPQFP